MLLEVAGKPVLWHTWNRATRSRLLDRLFIAAGDSVIAEAARSWGADVIEAFAECQSGSDRVWQAYRRFELDPKGCGLKIDSPHALHRRESLDNQSDIIVNIQGDEVQLEAETLDKVIQNLLNDPDAGVGTAAAPIDDFIDYVEPAIVKVVIGTDRRALYFSRSPIPSQVTQEKWQEAGLLRHIGIYAYRRAALEKFTQLTPSRLELLERLEQLRLLEQGVGYTVAIVQKAGVEVNTAEDLEKVRRENKA
jgi:3-deoxy-manno-octulosonate cytidylyltransferase (CMP-KDO synthetase)